MNEQERIYFEELKRNARIRRENPLPLPKATGTWHCQLMRTRRVLLNMGWSVADVSTLVPNIQYARTMFIIARFVDALNRIGKKLNLL